MPWRSLTWAFLMRSILPIFSRSRFLHHWSPVLLAALFLLTWGNGLGVQIYRYRSVSRPDQRQQTKWFVFACTLAIGLLILYFALQGLVPAFNQPDSLYQLAYATVTICA